MVKVTIDIGRYFYYKLYKYYLMNDIILESVLSNNLTLIEYE